MSCRQGGDPASGGNWRFRFGKRKFFNHFVKRMNQKSFANIILVIIVVVLVGAAGYFAFVKKPAPIAQDKTLPSTQNTVPPDKTAQWRTYTNTEYKYRVSYPPEWELGRITAEPSPAAVRFTKITKQDGKYLNDAVVDIIVEPNPLKKTPTEEWYREWVKQIPAGGSLEGVKIEETTFKSIKALKIDNSSIFFAKGFNMFRIKWHVAGDYNQSLVTSTEQIFEQMLANFEFFD